METVFPKALNVLFVGMGIRTSDIMRGFYTSIVQKSKRFCDSICVYVKTHALSTKAYDMYS